MPFSRVPALCLCYMASRPGVRPLSSFTYPRSLSLISQQFVRGGAAKRRRGEEVGGVPNITMRWTRGLSASGQVSGLPSSSSPLSPRYLPCLACLFYSLFLVALRPFLFGECGNVPSASLTPFGAREDARQTRVTRTLGSRHRLEPRHAARPLSMSRATSVP